MILRLHVCISDERQKGEYAIINKPEKSLLMGYGVADFAKFDVSNYLVLLDNTPRRDYL